MTILLKAGELYSTVVENSPEIAQIAWKRKDANAQKIIALSLGKKLLMYVLSCNTAHSMWTKLCSIYERDSEQQKYGLMQEFFSCTIDKSLGVATYISKIENTVCKLKALDAKVTDSMLMSKIFVTLPDTYRSFVTAWESTPQAEQTIENLTVRLLSEEAKNTEKEKSDSAVVFKTLERKCYKCNETGHLSKSCKKLAGENNNDRRCFK